MAHIFFTLLVAFVLIALGGGFGISSKTETYRINYVNALKRKDRSQAVYWGRQYYAKMSPYGLLRPIDEMSIQNDILAHIG
jgi:hypothetical protein